MREGERDVGDAVSGGDYGMQSDDYDCYSIFLPT